MPERMWHGIRAPQPTVEAQRTFHVTRATPVRVALLNTP
jgi:hypothetical protein